MQNPVGKIKLYAPCCDVVMYVWLDDAGSADWFIEFNSYGSYGNSDAGWFDLEEDAVVLNSGFNEIEVRP